ncbi:MAG: hypothetical protein AVDCRST_MAG26-734 [uncultured Chloroflexia bacterium]|uniref:Uncharacterized protein n=1 Tax=uncultured Chloroflexia bacterium TaxID=1672391 RepID=A0A6J4HKY0_9CHLR|nr:MAG: hypothetical protein AVDCRST_MAG26-734 [uncultured Chloroflexia bacterium]
MQAAPIIIFPGAARTAAATASAACARSFSAERLIGNHPVEPVADRRLCLECYAERVRRPTPPD